MHSMFSFLRLVSESGSLKKCLNQWMPNLGGGFNDSLFLPLPGKMIQVHEHGF